MTTEQALSLLKQLADLANVPLQAHQQAQTAFEILQAAVKK